MFSVHAMKLPILLILSCLLITLYSLLQNQQETLILLKKLHAKTQITPQLEHVETADEKSLSINIDGFDQCGKTSWKWTPPSLPVDLQHAPAEDSGLIDNIMANWLLLPCPREDLELKRPDQEDYSQYGQGEFIDRYLKNRNRGFYVECGAFNGELHSNSLRFELFNEWDGILIEADPKPFSALLSKHRHAYKINACLSPTNQASTFSFTINMGEVSGLTDQSKVHEQFHSQDDESNVAQVQCFPFYSIMEAVNQATAYTHSIDKRLRVDLFSLDIEGAEMDILKTIPYDKVDIELFLVEYSIPGNTKKSQEKYNEIKMFLHSKGYRLVEGCPDNADILMEKINHK